MAENRITVADMARILDITPMLVYSRLTRRHIKPVERIGRLGLYPAETAEKIRVVSRGGKRPGSGPKRKSNKNL